jgi:hypothetical protein
MKLPRLRLSRRMLLWLLAPLAFWALMLALVPTEWARARLTARLSQATGKHVRLGALRLGVFGDVRLKNLEIGEAEASADPWLRVADLRVNLHLFNVLFGQCEPSNVQADGLSLRVHRRADGTFEFGSLTAPRRPQTAASTGETSSHPDGCAFAFVVQNGTVNLIDDPSQTRLEFAKVESRGSWSRQRAVIESFHSQLSGGQLDLVAELNRSAELPMFEGQLRADGVALDGGMGALGYLIPVLSQTPPGVDGKLALNLYLRAEGATRDEIGRSLAGQGTVGLEPIRLDGSKIAAALGSIVDLPPSAWAQGGSVHSQFTIGKRRVTTTQLTLNVGEVPFLLAGWTDFDGNLDYRISSEGLTKKLPSEVRSFLADLPVKLDDVVSLHLRGKLNDLDVTVEGPPRGTASKDTPERRAEDRKKLRDLGRRLRDELLK